MWTTVGPRKSREWAKNKSPPFQSSSCCRRPPRVSTRRAFLNGLPSGVRFKGDSNHTARTKVVRVETLIPPSVYRTFCCGQRFHFPTNTKDTQIATASQPLFDVLLSLLPDNSTINSTGIDHPKPTSAQRGSFQRQEKILTDSHSPIQCGSSLATSEPLTSSSLYHGRRRVYSKNAL